MSNLQSPMGLWFSMILYVLSGNEKDVFLSNSVEDLTGGIVLVPGGLGKSVRRREKLDEAEDWKNNLYFELVTRNTEGEVREYQVQMVVDEVTK